LLYSWALDILFLLNLNYPIVFTQANDYSDLRGETRVFEKLFGGHIQYFMSPSENPFRAMSHYVDDNKNIPDD
jgi:hypothetical protein